jgi:LPXTG-motif cell wall-anchored protein
MTSAIVLNLLTDYQNVVRMAADAGEIWFTADYVRDYDGGYQVATFDAGGSNPQLPDTGLDASTLTATGVAIGAAGLLLLGFYVVRRRSVANAK